MIRSLGAGKANKISAIAYLSAILLFYVSVTQAQDVPPSTDPVAIFNQAQDLHEKGDLDGAIALYEKALKLMPEFPEAEFQRGTAFLAKGNLDLAEKGFRRASEIRADWMLPLANLGSLLVRRGKVEEAGLHLSRVLANQPNDPIALAAMVDLHLRNNAEHGILNEMLTRVTALTGKANPPAALWISRAALQLRLSDRSGAKASIERLLAAEPNSRDGLLLLAEIAISEGDIDRAITLASRLAGAEASDQAHLLRARIRAHEGRYADAIKELDAVRLRTADADALRKQIAAASAATPAELEARLVSDEKNPLILGRLCTMYRRADPPKALAFCRRASEAEPNNITHAVGFGAALVQAKQFEAAVGLFTKLLSHAPDNSTARANLATALFQLKRWNEAKVQFRLLTEMQPKAAAPYYFLAVVHDQLKEHFDAAANYQQYLRLADPIADKLEIEKVQLRLPVLQKMIKKS